MKSSKAIVEGYLNKKDWRVKENSNAVYSFGSLNKYITAEVSKDYWLREVYPENIAQAYVDGHMHIHDLGGLSLYCCGYSLKDILMKGVRGVQNIPVSVPAKHFDSALSQLANLVTVLQNEILGAVAFNSFDTLLAPFIKADRLTETQVRQAMQNFIFAINSNSRAGAEPAFSNLTFDLTPPADMLDEYCIVGGVPVSFTYGSCQQEMDMLNRAFFDIMLNGDGEGKLFAYPIPTYNIHKRFDWDNPNNAKLWEMAGKYGTPYFANFVNSEMDIQDVRSMCPLRNDQRVLVQDDFSKEWHISTIDNLADGKTYTILHAGEPHDAKLHRYNNLHFMRVTLVNGHSVILSDSHLNLTRDGVKRTDELTVSDYIPFDIHETDGYGLTYRDGYMVGAYMGDGSLSNDASVVYSLNETTKADCMARIIHEAEESYGAKISTHHAGNGNCTNVVVHSGMLRGLITSYVTGTALDKEIDAKAINRSVEFRRGILDGLIATDGSAIKSRIYTASSRAVESICAIAASLGIPTKITTDNRDSTQTLSDNPVYCIRLYNMKTGQMTYGDMYVRDDQYMWFRIKSIEPIDDQKTVGYCFEVEDGEEPYFMLPSGWVTHNCRLQLNLKELRRRNGGLFGSGDSTGSVGVVTINLPRLGYECKGDKVKFYSELAKYCDLAKDSLEIKRAWLQENVIDTHLIPAFMEYVGTLDNHFSTIGIVGMNEMCENFMGKDILDPDAKQFCLDVLQFIRDKLVVYQEETGHLYNLEATPAESTAYRFALKDKETYPDIITQGNGKNVYYTNSCHIPVSKVTSISETFAHQEALQKMFTGGTVIHCFLDGAITGEQAKQIVRETITNFGVPYMSLSPISRYCPDHGYVKEHVDKCPVCKQKLQKYQRITGYIRLVDNYNPGKAAEFADRNQL